MLFYLRTVFTNRLSTACIKIDYLISRARVSEIKKKIFCFNKTFVYIANI